MLESLAAVGSVVAEEDCVDMLESLAAVGSVVAEDDGSDVSVDAACIGAVDGGALSDEEGVMVGVCVAGA